MAAELNISAVGTAQPPIESSQYQTLTGVTPQYQVRIEIRGDEQLLSSGSKLFPIIAALPERYNMDMSSTWSSPYSQTTIAEAATKFIGSKTGAVVGAASAAAGVGSRLKAQSAQVWESSSSMSMTLALVFNALTNTKADIRDKHKALLKLCAPSELFAGQVLRAPGPSLLGSAAQEAGDFLGFDPKSRKISVYLGTYIVLENVVFTHVGSDVTTLCDVNGIPISMTINVSFESFYSCFTSEDIDKMFRLSE